MTYFFSYQKENTYQVVNCHVEKFGNSLWSVIFYGGCFCKGSIIAAVVNEFDEVALLKQNYVSTTKYVCVAGIMKIGESAEDTVIREVKEEIGQNVETLEFIRSYLYEKKEMLMLGYKATVKKQDFKMSGEVDSVEWVKYEDALSLLGEGSIGWQLVKQVIKQ